MGFVVHYSNRLDVLVERLAERTSLTAAHPLSPRCICVAHPGMRRWVSLELASRQGIVANAQFPLPASLVWSLLRAVVPTLGERSPYEPGILRWAILAILRANTFASDSPVGNYLAGADELMVYELADKLAHQLDRYLVYRPDWVKAWDAGECVLGDEAPDEGWQASLLSALRAELGLSLIHI